MLNQLGVTIPANINPQVANVAAVAIHATLPAFAKPGQKIDVNVLRSVMPPACGEAPY